MSRRKFLCLDCGLDTGRAGEFYMVRDDVWAKTRIPANGGMLCVGCIEGRIGRDLDASDFTACYVNRPQFGAQSLRLRSRLLGKVAA